MKYGKSKSFVFRGRRFRYDYIRQELEYLVPVTGGYNTMHSIGVRYVEWLKPYNKAYYTTIYSDCLDNMAM